MDFNVLPECYVDTKLVKVLVPPQKQYNHQKGTNVLRKMEDELANEFALGIVDEDVQDRKYAQAFVTVFNLSDSLRLLKHLQRPHYLIYICPAIEKWIIAQADAAQLSLTTYGLPHDFDKLRKISKTSKSERNDPFSENFQQLFRMLRQENPTSVAILKYWITYLKTNPYTADLNLLVSETNTILY